MSIEKRSSARGARGQTRSARAAPRLMAAGRGEAGAAGSDSPSPAPPLSTCQPALGRPAPTAARADSEKTGRGGGGGPSPEDPPLPGLAGLGGGLDMVAAGPDGLRRCLGAVGMIGASRSALLGTVRGDSCGEEGGGRAPVSCAAPHSGSSEHRTTPKHPATNPLFALLCLVGRAREGGGRPIGVRGLRSSQSDRAVSERAGLTAGPPERGKGVGFGWGRGFELR